ncbi:MAG TPA: hypothetical protein VGG74_11365 [Kofleriaceae bacterium]|jgi:hypothetical protein
MRAVAAAVFVIACGRSQGVPDRDLGGLVNSPPKPGKVDLDAAAKEPAALGAALALPEHLIDAALGPHKTTIAMATHVTENGKAVTDLDDTTTIELGGSGAFHAAYANSADYGREVTYLPARGSAAAELFLRPRYQRWHGRAPEAPDEAEQILDSFAEPVFATWDLVAPGAELTDRGAVQVAGRSGRKIEIKPASSPRKPAAEPLPQRAWRETRTIDGLSGEIVLDAETGVPLSVKLSGTIGFTRDNRKFAMQVSVQSDVSGIGTIAAVAAPDSDDVVATPERLREVDDRDFLLQGIAPPLRKSDAKKDAK